MKKNLLLIFVAALLFGHVNSTHAQSICPDGLNNVSVNTVTSIFGNEIQWYIFGDNGQVFLQSSTYQNNGNYFNAECLPDGCYTVHLHDTFGDGWNGGSMNITVDSVVMFSGTLNTGSDMMFTLSINSSGCVSSPNLSGCTDPNAANFNPSAVISDGSCLYAGCNDPSAINFNPNVDVLDSSCVYCNNGTNAHLYICTFGNGGEVSLSIVDSNGVVVFTNPVLNNVAIYNTDICLDSNMCYTAVMTNNAGNPGWYNGYFWINVGGVQIIHESLDPTLIVESEDFSVNGACGDVIIYGCTDVSASNFDTNADVNDGSCIYPIFGCTQINALNYNADATYNDGSCIMADVCGAMNLIYFDWTGDAFAFESSIALYDNSGNYVAYSSGSDTYACINDGCYYTTLTDNFGDGWGSTTLNIYLNGSNTPLLSPFLNDGMTDSMMVSINTTDCQMSITGCMDATAMNYNAVANIEDGSCVYSEDCQYGWTYIQTATGFWADEMSYSIVASNGDVLFEFEGDLNNATSTDFVCLTPDCYTVAMEDSWGDGWNGGYVFIANSLGYGEFYGGLNWGSEQEAMYSILSNCGAAIMGCMDSTALNYMADATEDDGSCMYNDNNPQEENPGMVLSTAAVKVYPNPASQSINVFVQGLEWNEGDYLQFHIYSAEGKLVNQGQWNQGQINYALDISGLSSGMYFMELKNENGNVVTRFSKQ
jgi:hypothetical protein